jgi:hypothetical protein
MQVTLDDRVSHPHNFPFGNLVGLAGRELAVFSTLAHFATD